MCANCKIRRMGSTIHVIFINIHVIYNNVLGSMNPLNIEACFYNIHHNFFAIRGIPCGCLNLKAKGNMVESRTT